VRVCEEQVKEILTIGCEPSIQAGSRPTLIGMLSVTGLPLLVLATALAFGAPALAAWSWQRLDGRTATVVSGRVAAVLVAQLVAVSAVFLWVNRSYDFYTSWSDVLGRTHQDAGITVNRASAPDGSRTTVLDIAGPDVGAARQALVWLPKQYDEPAYAHTRFPVVVFLPGQPSTPGTMYRKFDVGGVATKAIDSGRTAPFVAVLPALMTDPPRDTECTDIPHGPQAETYLTRELPDAVEHQLRVDPPGREWTLAGWSTGAFCAAKLGLSDRGAYGSVVGFGGYYRPVTDRTTGDLFHGDRRLEEHNSPLWLYDHLGTHGVRMLLISGRQDRESWPSTTRMLQASSGNPDVSYVSFPAGGHNFRNYRAYLGQALQWAHPAGGA
jgi:predicted esterase